MRALEFIRDHVTFKLPYDFSYQMKTPLVISKIFANSALNFKHFSQSRGQFSHPRSKQFWKQNTIFYFLCHFSGRQLWSANSGVPYSISTPKRHLLFTRNPGQYMSKVGEGYLHRGKSIEVILFQVHEDLNKFNTSFASFEFQNNLCKSS